MLNVSAIMTIMRQNLYKNIQSKLNTDGERSLPVTNIVLS